MRLGILVPINSLKHEMDMVQRRYTDISIQCITYSSVFEIPDLLRGKQKELDYLLFFGKTTHAYVARKITPTIPWDVIPRTNATLFLILFKALLNGSNVYSLATDLHPAEKKMLYDSYQEVGVDLSKVTVDYAPSFTFDEMFVSRMKDFYYRCRQKDPNVTCITIYSEVYNQLAAEKFPIVYLISTLTDIYNAIENAHNKFLLRMSRESQLVIIYISIDDVDKYSPLSSDEYQMTLETLTVTKYIHIFAQKIQGAVFAVTERDFLIFSTRTIVESQTEKFHRFTLVDDVKKNTASTVSIGIGFGKTAMEAKKHAKIGVKRAQQGGGNQLFLVYDKATIRGPFRSEDSTPPPIYISDRFLCISSQTGISSFTLAQIHKIINEQGRNEFTPVEIADLLNVSMRSMNRTILKLIDTGHVVEVGKKFQSKGGRPSRILRFNL